MRNCPVLCSILSCPPECRHPHTLLEGPILCLPRSGSAWLWGTAGTSGSLSCLHSLLPMLGGSALSPMGFTPGLCLKGDRDGLGELQAHGGGRGWEVSGARPSGSVLTRFTNTRTPQVPKSPLGGGVVVALTSVGTRLGSPRP